MIPKEDDILNVLLRIFGFLYKRHENISIHV